MRARSSTLLGRRARLDAGAFFGLGLEAGELFDFGPGASLGFDAGAFFGLGLEASALFRFGPAVILGFDAACSSASMRTASASRAARSSASKRARSSVSMRARTSASTRGRLRFDAAVSGSAINGAYHFRLSGVLGPRPLHRVGVEAVAVKPFVANPFVVTPFGRARPVSPRR